MSDTSNSDMSSSSASSLALGSRLEFLLEGTESLADLIQSTNPVQRQADDARLFGQRLQDRLPDPPHGVGDEFEPAGLVEPLGRFDQAEVPFVDQIAQRQPLVLILLRDADDEPEVGFGEFLESALIPLLDPLRELDFLFGLEQIDFADFLQILVERLALPIRILLGDLHHSRTFRWS